MKTGFTKRYKTDLEKWNAYVAKKEAICTAYSFVEFMFTYSSRFLVMKVEATNEQAASKKVEEDFCVTA